MQTTTRPAQAKIVTLLLLLLFFSLVVGAASLPASTLQTGAYIVQAGSVETAVAAVQSVGGTVTHELGIINSVGANLTPVQFARLQNNPQYQQHAGKSCPANECWGQLKR